MTSFVILASFLAEESTVKTSHPGYVLQKVWFTARVVGPVLVNRSIITFC